MGTSCLTFVYDEHERPLICIHRIYDGYTTGHGSELANFLEHRLISNGLYESDDSASNKRSNGMGDLAAQLLMILKAQNTYGNIYLISYIPTRLRHVGQEFEYHIYPYSVRVYKYLAFEQGNAVPFNRQCIFDGTWEKFLAYVDQERRKL